MEIEKIISELTLEEKAGLMSGKDFWKTKAVERLGLPQVMMCDGPCGLRKQLGEGDHLGINESIKTVCYPSAAAMACSFDREALGMLGEALGKECQAEHVAMLLGPGINIKRSPLGGRNFEYFSEDPYLAGQLAAAYIRALQGEGVAACVKHFAANSQETDRMSCSSEVDERTLHEIYYPAFEAAVKEGKTRGLMCAYNQINGTFCSENHELLTDTLREDWGYEGMVVTDWGAVKNRVEGVKAGIDLEMPGGPGSQDRRIVEAVKSGELPEEVLDKAVGKMLRFILTAKENQKEDAVIDREECANISRELSEKSAVLLKNGGLLPLADGQKVIFMGPFAKAPRYQGGGSSHINTEKVTGAVEAAEKTGLSVEYLEQFDAERIRLADAVVVFAGLPDAFETEGADRESMAIPDEQNALIEAVASANKNTAVVLHGGSVMELPWLSRVKAVLCMYLGGQNVGEAAVRLLFGEANPSGKLAETWPLHVEDNPSYLNFPDEAGKVRYCERVYVGYRYYDKKKMPVQFPFGYGLSYTTFAYSDLIVDKNEMRDDEILTVSCTVKNTGARAGAEAVQLYVRDLKSSIGRPVRELKGFEKVLLAPGEEKKVTFSLDMRAFAYYETRIHGWFVESGEFAVEIGASSRDIRLSRTVTVQGTKELPIHYTPLSTIGDLAKTEIGRKLLVQLTGGGQKMDEAKKNQMETMGEGAAQTMEISVMGMPLQSVVTFGRMTQEQLDTLLAALNGETI